MKNLFGSEFILIAHRGASYYEPENTILSFQKAINQGAAIIEFDVRKTLDGNLVVLHDSKVDRTTNGKGLIKNMNLSEINQLDAGKGEKIPTVREVFELFKDKVKFVVELKEEDTEELVLDLIYEFNLMKDVILVSFRKKVLKKIKTLDSNIITGLITLTGFGCVKSAVGFDCNAVASHAYFANKNRVEDAHQNNLLFFCWTVDDKKTALKLKELGVDGLITNKPDLLNN
ncbi:MAG: glycerophosphodiester phosphodiesterase [Thermodesulfobacteriota bacterium]